MSCRATAWWLSRTGSRQGSMEGVSIPTSRTPCACRNRRARARGWQVLGVIGIRKRIGAEQDARRLDVGTQLGWREASASTWDDLDDLTRAIIMFERTRSDAGAAVDVMARSIGVGAEVQRRLHRGEVDVVAARDLEARLAPVGDVARENSQALRDERRDVDDACAHGFRQLAAAITLSSTAIGVGNAVTANVVRVAPMPVKYSA